MNLFDRALIMADRKAKFSGEAVGSVIGRGDYPHSALQGITKQFRIYLDPSVGPGGTSVCDGVRNSCEGDLATIIGYFGGVTPPRLPFNIIVTKGIGGAYHHGCAGVDIYCEASTVPAPNAAFTSLLMVAEIVEVFEAFQARGWKCRSSNGEALSRVIAVSLYPKELTPTASSAHSWLDSSRPDWINRTKASDTDTVAVGCGVLFLNYLRNQLKFSWELIVQSGGSTLAECYKKLTKTSKNPFPAFASLLLSKFPANRPSGLKSDNPFPIRLKS